MKVRETRLVKIADWKPKHTQILALYQERKENKEIAETVGLAERTIRHIIQSQIFQSKLATFEKNVENRYADKIADEMVVSKARQVIYQNAENAAENIVRLAKGEMKMERLQYDANMAIVSMVGLKAPDKQQIEISEKQCTPEEAESAKKTVLEMLEVSERLKNSGSRFILRDVSVSSETEEGSSDPNKSIASSTGQEVLPEEPVLSS